MPSHFIILDVQTTGHYPDTHRVLEIGALHIDITTLEVLHRFQAVAGIPKRILDAIKIEDFILKIHTSNGLLAEVSRAPECDMFCLDVRLSDWFRGLGMREQEIILFGNNICSGRGFLYQHMPVSYGFLSDRFIDISFLSPCYKAWAPSHRRHKYVHRSIPNCEQDIEVLRWLKNIFVFGSAAP